MEFLEVDLSVENPEVNVNLLGFNSTKVAALYAYPTVLSCSLLTLILEKTLSVFKTKSFSVPTPVFVICKTSFALKTDGSTFP